MSIANESLGGDLTSGVGTGAALGSVVPGFGTAVGAAIGLGIGGIKYLSGASQRRAAASMHPFNPGYEINREAADNARILGQNYTNYQLPGYSQLLDNLKTTYNSGVSSAMKGATSSADLLDQVNKLGYTQDQALKNLAVTGAEGKQNALLQYLQAKSESGQQYQDQNEYERNEYEKQLQLKNQLNNNGIANEYGAADQAGKLVASIFANRGYYPTTGPMGVVKKGSPLNFGIGGSNTVDNLLSTDNPQLAA